ncbi:MAG TPA: ankyrin repeat domain-containing protein [Candidatus Polarisedimenticolaceae bacterium]|nr:ankyrin repeat domain-containing protein [Candidatus Polarisedimenticolaceae bacterium]
MNRKLFEAIDSGEIEPVREMIGRDPALAVARDERGVSAVGHARYRMRPELVELLLAAGPELDLFDAAAVGRVERLRELLDGDPSLVSAVSGDGGSALHLAAFLGSADAVRLLLERGADADAVAPGFNEVKPLHSAVASRRPEVVHLLLEHGCDVNAKQRGGFNALHAAAHAGMTDVVDALLARGADPKATNDAGRTATDLAREAGHHAIAERLALATSDDG